MVSGPQAQLSSGKPSLPTPAHLSEYKTRQADTGICIRSIPMRSGCVSPTLHTPGRSKVTGLAPFVQHSPSILVSAPMRMYGSEPDSEEICTSNADRRSPAISSTCGAAHSSSLLPPPRVSGRTSPQRESTAQLRVLKKSWSSNVTTGLVPASEYLKRRNRKAAAVADFTSTVGPVAAENASPLSGSH